jgi:hypothetical protein
MGGIQLYLHNQIMGSQSVEMANVGVEMSNEGVEMANEGVEMADEGVEMANEGVEVANEGVKTANEGVEMANEGVKVANEGVKMASEAVEVADEGVKTANEGVEMANEGVEMANEGVEMANDAFAIAFKSLKKANGQVGHYMAKIRVIEEELKECEKLNPRYLEDEALRHLYEHKKQIHKEANNCLDNACDRLNKANDYLKETSSLFLQLTQLACQVSSSHPGIPESFREMIAIQRRHQGYLEETKGGLISLRHKKSSNAYKERVLGAFDAPKKADQRNIVPNFVGTLGTNTDQFNPTSFAFKRDGILEKMFTWINFQERMHRFLLLDSPAASGKTSLLIMFQLKYPQLNVHYVSMNSKSDPYDCLIHAGLDIKRRTCKYDQVIYILDDAQFQYDHPTFCHMLIKDVPLHFHRVQFIISVTHMITRRSQPNSYFFADLEKISNKELLLSCEQSLQLLNSQSPLGLPTHMQNFSQLKNAIIEHCNGLIGALCKSVHFFADKLCVHMSTEEMCLQAYYSKNLLDEMHCCFGIVRESCIPAEANDILLKCLLGKGIHSILGLNHSFSGIIASFAKAGILSIDENKHFGFSSILAKRYFLHHYYKHRAISDPATLCELVVKVIESMSANAIMSSTTSPEDFPKEATFQHLFMTGLLRHTSCNTAVCPELSRSFATNTNVKGHIEFIMGGNLMWGIELVRGSNKIKEHMSQFGQKGKYAGLNLKDYIVLDFCQGGEGVKNIIQGSHQASASFTVDTAGCACYKNVVFRYENDKPLILQLQP